MAICQFKHLDTLFNGKTQSVLLIQKAFSGGNYLPRKRLCLCDLYYNFFLLHDIVFVFSFFCLFIWSFSGLSIFNLFNYYFLTIISFLHQNYYRGFLTSSKPEKIKVSRLLTILTSTVWYKNFLHANIWNLCHSMALERVEISMPTQMWCFHQ